MRRPLLSGAVLAGGAGRRLGVDKALLAWDGERLVDRQVRVLATVADDVVVVSGRRVVPGLAVPQVADPGEGPLGGVVAALHAARHDLVAVVAVDQPFTNAAVLVALARAWSGEAAVLPRVRGRSQPLHAVYARAALPHLAHRLAAGERSLLGALEALAPAVVDEDGWSAFDPHGAFADDVDYPDDVARLSGSSPTPSRHSPA